MSAPVSQSSSILQAVAAAVRISPAKQSGLLIGVSGGADSVALFRCLVLLADELKLRLAVAHLNHGLRGDASDADADWVERLTRQFQIPIAIKKVDISSLAEHSGETIEEAARNSRYRFFLEAAIQLNCSLIATAHTVNDQVETVLHNLIRGTGLAGLGGIPRDRALGGSRLIRPLLQVTRNEVLQFLSELGQEFRTDDTNSDISITRNRIRHELIPLLQSQFNPQLGRGLLQLADQAEEAQNSLRFVAKELAKNHRCEVADADWGILWQALQIYPRHLLREMFVAIWCELDWPRQGMTFRHWNRLVDLLHSGGRCDFPDRISVQRIGRFLLLMRRELEPRPTESSVIHSL